MSDLELPKGITSVVENGLNAYRIDTPQCSGLVYEHGAHVASWKPAGQDEVLWMSDNSVFSPDKAIRGGVPICFPWFGPGRSGDRTPAHGFARLSEWYLVGASVEKGVAKLSLELTGDEVDDLGGFPSDFTARLDVSMGNELTLALTVAAGETPLVFEEALHTYFRVSDIHDVKVLGLDGVTFVDKVAGGAATQEGPVIFSGRTDRVYPSAAATQIVDPVRKVTIDKVNSGDSVVWNPWDEIAASMADFASDAWPQMVCVEAANCLGNEVTVQPGEAHTMSFTASIS